MTSSGSTAPPLTQFGGVAFINPSQTKVTDQARVACPHIRNTLELHRFNEEFILSTAGRGCELNSQQRQKYACPVQDRPLLLWASVDVGFITSRRRPLPPPHALVFVSSDESSDSIYVHAFRFATQPVTNRIVQGGLTRTRSRERQRGRYLMNDHNLLDIWGWYDEERSAAHCHRVVPACPNNTFIPEGTKREATPSLDVSQRCCDDGEALIRAHTKESPFSFSVYHSQ